MMRLIMAAGAAAGVPQKKAEGGIAAADEKSIDKSVKFT